MVWVDVGWTRWLVWCLVGAACVDEADGGGDNGDTTGDASSATASSTSSGGSSGGSSAGSDSESTATTGFDFGACYDPLTHPWSGSLCGSAATPCAVEMDERIDEHPADALAHGITLDDDCNPHVIYSQYGEAYSGFLASRSAAGAWSSVAMPGSAAGGAIAWDTEIDVLRVLAYDGAGAIAQLLYDGEFSEAAGLSLDAGVYLPDAQGAASLGHGTWHVGVKILSDTVPEDVTHAFFDGEAWTTEAIGPGYLPAVAASADDAGHLGYLQLDGAELDLAYLDVGGAPTTVAGNTDGTYVALELAGEVPHLFFEGPGTQPNERRIALASSPSGARWSVATVAVGTDDGCGPPQVDGETCEFDYLVESPLAMAASGNGDVRLFYREDHHIGSRLAMCDEFSGCEWTTVLDEVESVTWIAAPDGDGFAASVLLERPAVAIDVAIDGTGHMHLVVTSETDGASAIDYLRLGG